jgi:hypothetical protein
LIKTTLENNSQYNFQSSSKYLIIFLGILALGTILAIVIGIIIEILNLSTASDGMLLFVVGLGLSPFTVILFLYFYLPTKNILTLESDQVTIKTYRELRSYHWVNVESMKVKFHPEGKKGGSGIGSAITQAVDAIAESVRDERSDASGKITFELKSNQDKKKLTFMNLKFGDCLPLIEKISELTKIDPQKEKFVRKWELSKENMS